MRRLSESLKLFEKCLDCFIGQLMIILCIAMLFAPLSAHGDALDDALSSLQQQKPYLFYTPSTSRANNRYKATVDDVIAVITVIAVLHTYYQHYHTSSPGFFNNLAKNIMPLSLYTYSQHSTFAIHLAIIGLQNYCSKKILHWIIDRTIG